MKCDKCRSTDTIGLGFPCKNCNGTGANQMKVTKVEQAEFVHFADGISITRLGDGEWQMLGKPKEREAAYQRYKSRDKKVQAIRNCIAYDTPCSLSIEQAEKILDKLEAIDRGEG